MLTEMHPELNHLELRKMLMWVKLAGGFNIGEGTTCHVGKPIALAGKH